VSRALGNERICYLSWLVIGSHLWVGIEHCHHVDKNLKFGVQRSNDNLGAMSANVAKRGKRWIDLLILLTYTLMICNANCREVV